MGTPFVRVEVDVNLNATAGGVEIFLKHQMTVPVLPYMPDGFKKVWMPAFGKRVHYVVKHQIKRNECKPKSKTFKRLR